MKGIILAGGTGTRLRPLTQLLNKHLLPVGKYPMIVYGIETLRKAGITDIMLIISKQSAGLYIDFLGSGAGYGVNLTYRIQEESGGIAEALDLAKGFILPQEKFGVLLGDNLFADDLAPFVTAFKRQKPGTARVLLKEVDDPRRYGVPAFDAEHSELISYIEEKPEHPETNYSVTGFYLFDADVFNIISGISPSARGELEITDVNNAYARAKSLEYDILSGYWSDAGTFESLQDAAIQMKKILP
ncbi:sugar phosphate nucleotidyltransferase [Paenibacillus shunpengii]|uniref:Glucose-1-phosphate thymidylyltransferase n=1 Tax=Paenibacillus shunpengii TaxID=2054424 RepID=A0ABW5SSX8_9BACL